MESQLGSQLGSSSTVSGLVSILSVSHQLESVDLVCFHQLETSLPEEVEATGTWFTSVLASSVAGPAENRGFVK